jgi:hypothetical protein
MRLLVFDRTCRRLSLAWRAGAQLYRRLGRIDAARGVASWDEALEWLASHERITELQYWGHGKWGAALVDRTDVLDARRFDELAPVFERLAPPASPKGERDVAPLIWFRTCETFGARVGIEFAEQLAERSGARVAGHTHVIGFHQSGLHGLAPGARADWSPDEGLAAGSADAPERARGSRPWRPRTITCLDNTVPAAWFATV